MDGGTELHVLRRGHLKKTCPQSPVRVTQTPGHFPPRRLKSGSRSTHQANMCAALLPGRGSVGVTSGRLLPYTKESEAAILEVRQELAVSLQYGNARYTSNFMCLGVQLIGLNGHWFGLVPRTKLVENGKRYSKSWMTAAVRLGLTQSTTPRECPEPGQVAYVQSWSRELKPV
ncbi:hypothetical protein BO99DRAFT_411455 [Aspergillus violaceofuscus CBS 115571]|uniref:Uncharacterized protein n=1 Tax=Aspergillus violaceofuscus (strain CBS 115571) TaxID=1450538 RepID=A0A2V5H8L7_ASPV1|nr:hypothetical protein BO99DRAFT_411455 [Aspergillus violaceofuscus CBS 115571]